MKSRVFIYKTRRLMRIPAQSEPVVDASLFVLMTEDGETIAAEDGEALRTEQDG